MSKSNAKPSKHDEATIGPAAEKARRLAIADLAGKGQPVAANAHPTVAHAEVVAVGVVGPTAGSRVRVSMAAARWRKGWAMCASKGPLACASCTMGINLRVGDLYERGRGTFRPLGLLRCLRGNSPTASSRTGAH
jgi:hypothetical protein